MAATTAALPPTMAATTAALPPTMAATTAATTAATDNRSWAGGFNNARDTEWYTNDNGVVRARFPN